MVNIKENIAKIKADIKASCQKVNRSPNEVRLLAVSKTIERSLMEEALALGLDLFGENRAQELTEKLTWNLNVKWHFIGSLQTNKVKDILPHVELIHSLDRLSLARELQKRAEGKIIDCLLEINVAKEKSKAGLTLEESESFLKSLAKYPNLRIKGLMTIAPLASDEEEVRQVFRALKLKQSELKKMNLIYAPLDELSMGMSGDYRIAIEEGATIVRIGTGVFGPRS